MEGLKDQSPITIIFIAFVIFLYVFLVFALLYRDILYALQRKRQGRKDFKENIEKSAVREPQVLRELRGDERDSLAVNHKLAVKYIQTNPVIIPANLLLIAIIFIVGLQNNLLHETVFLLVLYILTSVLALQVRYTLRERKIYSDLRSPVFKVEGELLKRFKGTGSKGKSPKRSFTIRGVQFNNDENQLIDENWEKWSDGDTVSVEYSPFTKHIWKIEKV